MAGQKEILTAEDSLRLNVLMTQAEAIRIDESTHQVIGLADGRELRVVLHPRGREEVYLQAVRRLLATLVTGHSGGFPVYIRRWLRGGHLGNLRIDDLLRLGEPEAVLAAAAVPSLDEATARRLWWALPEAPVARALLANRSVSAAALRGELAEFLAEHLPFEREADAILETLRLIAAPGVLEPARRARLWRRGNVEVAYRVGFLVACADALPEPPALRAEAVAARAALAPLAEAGNAPAAALLRLLDVPGQAFLGGCADVLANPQQRLLIATTLNTLGRYCGAVALPGPPCVDDAQLAARVERACAEADGELGALLAARPEQAPQVRAMLFLGGVHEGLCYPVFARSTAVGSQLRGKLAAVLDPIATRVATLTGSRPEAPGQRRRRVS